MMLLPFLFAGNLLPNASYSSTTESVEEAKNLACEYAGGGAPRSREDKHPPPTEIVFTAKANQAVSLHTEEKKRLY
jgi:hypothetical protein